MIKKILRWIIALSLVFFLLLQAWQFFVAIPLWKLSSAEIHGNLFWPEDAFLAQIEIPEGQSIFAIDLKALQKEIERLPQVKKAKLYRKLPSTILINIKERSPWAISKIGSDNIIIGSDGKILNLTGVQILATEKLITIKGLSSINELEPFAKKFAGSLISLQTLFPDQHLNIKVQDLFEIQCRVNGHLLILWGTEENAEQKIKILEAILPVIKGKWRNIAYIDVRSPKNLAVRYLHR